MTTAFNHLRHIAPFADVHHRVKVGGIISHHFDFEAFGLNSTFAQIVKYGSCIGDFAGNRIAKKRINVRRLDLLFPTLGASLVVPDLLETMDAPDSVPHYLAMGMIAEDFERAPFRVEELGLPTKFITGQNHSKRGPHYIKSAVSELVSLYPVLDQDGRIIDAVRYHPEREKFSYRVIDVSSSPLYENVDNLFYTDEEEPNQKWKWADPISYTSGYRVRSYDRAVLNANLVRAGFSPRNIFFLTTRATLFEKQRRKNVLVDQFYVTLAAAKFGDQSEEGIKLGRKRDSETGEMVESAKLELIYKENTHDADPIRGISEGLVLSDGTRYEEAQGHVKPEYDADLSYGLEAHHRRVNPEIIKLHEQQADKTYLQKFLPALAATDQHRPVYFLPKSNYPDDTSVAPYFFIRFDDIDGQQNRGIFLRIHENLATCRVLGKALHQMTPTDWRHYIEKSRNTPDELVVIANMNRWRGAIPEDIAYASPVAHQLDLETIDSDVNYIIENTSISTNLGLALAELNWERVQRPEDPNPYMEEQAIRNGFGDLDYLVAAASDEKRRQVPNIGGVSSVTQFLAAKAQDIYNYHNAMDEALHLVLLQPHFVDFRDDEEALDIYNDLMKRIIRRLRKKKSPYVPVFDGYLNEKGMPVFASIAKVREFREKKLIEMLGKFKSLSEKDKDLFARGYFDYNITGAKNILFANLSRDFRIVDHRGREYHLEDLERIHPQLLIKGIEGGKWRIQFDRLSTDFSVQAILFRFASLEQLDRLPDGWQQRYAVIRDSYIKGRLNEPAHSMSIPAAPFLAWDAQQYLVNAHSKDTSIARVRVSFATGRAEGIGKSPESHRIYIKWQDKFTAWQKSGLPDTPEVRRAKNYNADGSPLEAYDHEIADDKSITLKIPDALLRYPTSDFRLGGPKAILVSEIPEAVRMAITRNGGKNVIIEGRDTGRLYATGTMSVKALPPQEQFPNLYDQSYRALSTIVHDQNMVFGNMLVFEELHALANARSIDLDCPSLHLPNVFFDALVRPEITGLPRQITGQIYITENMTQTFKADDTLALYESGATPSDVFSGRHGKTSGHLYQTTISAVRHLSLFDLEQDIQDGRFDDNDAQALGYAGAHDLARQIREQANSLRIKNPDQWRLTIVKFQPVDRASWAFFTLTEKPRAVLVSNSSIYPNPLSKVA